jgi:hypothetical protein
MTMFTNMWTSKKQLVKPNQFDLGHNDNVYQYVNTIDW